MAIKRIALILLAWTLALCSAAAAESEAFRNGKVLEVTGGAVVLRSGYEMPAYPQMMIQTGDQVETAADGWVVLCLDEDKYIILEPETKAAFELEGDSRRGMIGIHLLQGAIYTEIENPLSDGDGYEINTADGVMAVRGTNFRAAYGTDDENLQRKTEIQLFFGELVVSTTGDAPRTETLTDGEQMNLTTMLDENGEPVGEAELGEKRPLNLDNLPEKYDRDKLEKPSALFGEEDVFLGGTPLCGACGQEIMNEYDHAPVKSQSNYCKEQHYRCVGLMHHCDPNHDYNPDKEGIQEGCGDAYGCKRSNAHTLCRMCGDMWCDYENGGHETACGNARHRPCQINQRGRYRKSEHVGCTYGCGEYLCNGQSHGSAPCGQHCTTQGGEHTPCAYGCGGYLCDSASHGTGSGQCSPVICTYCAAEGVQHGSAPCGQHCTTQGGEHTPCAYGCGGYLCDSASHGTGSGQCSPVICTYCAEEGVQHDAQACGMHCTTQAGDHTVCICGGWGCVGTHGEMVCGHYCQQSDSGHEACPYGCGGYLCNGNSHSEELCRSAPGP